MVVLILKKMAIPIVVAIGMRILEITLWRQVGSGHWHVCYCNLNITGTVNLQRTGLPRCSPGFHLGMVEITRIASLSKYASTPRTLRDLKLIHLCQQQIGQSLFPLNPFPEK